MAEDTTLHAEGERTHIVNPRGLIQPGEETHKYRLKTPTFTSVEDVEQFASEFHETWDITRWPPRVALAKLRGALMGEAKPYGQRPSVDGIFVALRARFGITAPDARSRLQRILRKEDTPPPRSCPRSEETGTDRIQRPTRNTATTIHARGFHPIHQPPQPKPPTPGKRSHIPGSRP